MEKKFNITGTCIPSRHYMADTSEKLAQILKMVENGEYFTINRPRQYGKTTTLAQMVDVLEHAGFLTIRMSFEGLDSIVFDNSKVFSLRFLEMLAEKIADAAPDLSEWLSSEKENIENLNDLSRTITQLVKKSPRKIALLIDEVDKSSNNQLFLNFLGLLRQKFLDAAEENDHTFHSIILAGVHDVKNLKLKLRPGEEQKFNSPWNIASDFNVEMSLLPHEIVPMLQEYARDRNVTLDAQTLADRIFFYTSGYPFLVSKLCKIFDETLLPQKTERTWTDEDIETAVNILVKENNPNFENLTKNLENNPELYQLAYSLVIDGQYIPFNIHDPIINLGIMHGVFQKNGRLTIHNRIYSEIIANYMTLRLIRQQIGNNIPLQTEGLFTLPDKSLDMESLLLRFQVFMQEEYSTHDKGFLERHGRLVFLAFLKPILNGNGYAFKEPQVSEELRLDVVITYFQRKYLVELKVWRGEKAHKQGIEQLADYLERQNLDKGYLIVFDHRNAKTWEKKRFRKAGKKIFAVWV